MRIFIIQHDAGHGSSFKRGAPILSPAIPAFTMVAYKQLAATMLSTTLISVDLGERGDGDVWTMTVDEHSAAPRLKRIAYRIFRNPSSFRDRAADPFYGHATPALSLDESATASAHRSGGTTPRSWRWSW
ncbi:MAG: hypothetical protein R2838_01640 [Caldilineaceae bacterium]